MPYHAKRSCMHPGCSATYNGQGAYCDKHKGAHDYGKTYNDSKRDQSRQTFETSSRWRKIRHAYMARHPLCADCLDAGRITQAQEVHHIDDNYNHNGELNLMSLCTSCHSKRTRSGK